MKDLPLFRSSPRGGPSMMVRATTQRVPLSRVPNVYKKAVVGLSDLLESNRIINPRPACTARVTVVGLSVSLCVPMLFRAVQATRRPISDTNGFRTTRA